VFFVLGGLLGVCLGGWVVYSFAMHPLSVEIAESSGPEPRGGVPGMPDQEMQAAVAKATNAMKSNYQSSHLYRWRSRCADWVAFFLTATITVIVGATGRNLQAPTPPPSNLPVGAVPPDAADLGRKWVRRIGVMAALASVMITVSSRVTGVSQERLERAEKLRGKITESRVAYAGATTPAEAQKIVDDLVAETVKQS
jgi:hypothetical protein